MKIKNVLYVVLMIIFMMLSYILMSSGVNTKTKIYVNYKNDSDVLYKVYLRDNDKTINMNNEYNASLVDKINLDFSFDSKFSHNINGYYKYNIEGILTAYTDDIDDALFKRKYILLSDIGNPLNGNDNTIKINQDIDIFYDVYKEELKRINKEYETIANGLLEIRFNVLESLNFNGIDGTKEFKKQIKVIIPLSEEVFKIDIINDKNDVDSYYDFSKVQPVNYLLIFLGGISLSFGVAFLLLVIRNMIIAYKRENSYSKELNSILEKYDDIIVNIKRFYNKKKYNLIYVTSFDELIDAYKKVGNPISFREIKKNSEAIFLLLDDDNAWIYKMNKKNFK